MKNILPSRHTFRKEERLSGKKKVDELFSSGSSFYLPPLKVIAVSTERSDEPSVPVQVLITVSSKNVPRAVDRNRIKRRIREAYRLNKYLLYDELKKLNKKLLLGFVYTSKKIEPFPLIQEKVIASLQKISAQL